MIDAKQIPECLLKEFVRAILEAMDRDDKAKHNAQRADTAEKNVA